MVGCICSSWRWLGSYISWKQTRAVGKMCGLNYLPGNVYSWLQVQSVYGWLLQPGNTVSNVTGLVWSHQN